MTSTIGKIESATKSAVIASPLTAAIFKAEPPRRPDADLAEEWNREQREIREAVEGESPDLQHFECFLFVDADEHGQVLANSVMSARKAMEFTGVRNLGCRRVNQCGKQMVPSCDHGQASVGGEVQTESWRDSW